MATYSSILAWRIPWTEKPCKLQSTGSQRVRHDWSDLAHMHIFFVLSIIFSLTKECKLSRTTFIRSHILNILLCDLTTLFNCPQQLIITQAKNRLKISRRIGLAFKCLKNRLGFKWRSQWHPTPVLLPGKSHGWRSLEGCSPWDRWGSDMTERLHFHFSLSCLGEGNGNPLQCSCLENPRDGGAWWAAVYGVTQSWTWLKWLSSRILIWGWAEAESHGWGSLAGCSP